MVSPPVWLGPAVVEVADEEPARWPALVVVHVLATHAGAFAFAGTDPAAAGLASAEPTWTVPTDRSAVWPPDWLEPALVEVADDEPACWPPLDVVHALATHTGAFTLTGADTAAAGSTVTDPTCTVPADSSAD